MDCFASLAMTVRMTVKMTACDHDSRISSSRRPSLFNNFFTGLEAKTSAWLA
jgi:hypothetical protein